MHGNALSKTEQAWSAFEREMFGMREALAAVHHIVKGFPVIVYTDHRNNLFTSSLLGNRRIHKKLLGCALDLEEMGSRIKRVWIKSKDHALGDAPSRIHTSCHEEPVPSAPVKRIIRAMFSAPGVSREEEEGLEQFLARLDDSEPEEEDHPFPGMAGAEEQAAKTAPVVGEQTASLEHRLSVPAGPCSKDHHVSVLPYAHRVCSAGGTRATREGREWMREHDHEETEGPFDGCAVVAGIDFPEKGGKIKPPSPTTTRRPVLRSRRTR